VRRVIQARPVMRQVMIGMTLGEAEAVKTAIAMIAA
jgi:hypothetical protein